MFDQAKSFGTCEAFMEELRNRIAEAVVRYADASDIVHEYVPARFTWSTFPLTRLLFLAISPTMGMCFYPALIPPGLK
jgi:hypothetical protein